MTRSTPASYEGFEQGPIRPPSEAYSLLIRVSRNCPWNRCTFCSTYKDERFTLRPVEDVIRDIDIVHRYIDALRRLSKGSGMVTRNQVVEIRDDINPGDMQAFNAALHWFAAGMSSVFLQDANSLIVKPADLVHVLKHIKNRFPWIERITSYARSHTVARIKSNDLKEIADAGLNRIHIGMETGSDRILQMVKKGVTKEMHIKAGRNAKAAGIELSEYVLTGLGGKKFSREHAIETADALSRINPDFIRFRNLSFRDNSTLYEKCEPGSYERATDIVRAKEILLLMENLNGITSQVKSDHMNNLLEEVEGTLPEDKPYMMDVLRAFIEMEPERRVLYQIGKRLRLFSRLSDMENPDSLEEVEKVCRDNGIAAENVDDAVYELMLRARG